MKPISLLFISVFAILNVQAQSKKIINQQLLIQLQTLQKTADSIYQVRWDKHQEITSLRGNVRELESSFTRVWYEETSFRSQIRQNHEALTQLGFDPNTVITLADLDAMPSPMKGNKFTERAEIPNPVFKLVNKPVVQDLTDVKIKTQNQLLNLAIVEFRKTNAANDSILGAMQTHINQLNNVKSDYSVLLSNSTQLNKTLAAKHEVLYLKKVELTQKKEEEERLKELKAIEVANKSKSKKSKDNFVPPVIIDREPDPDYWDRGDMNVSGGDFGFEAPPPPPPVADPPQPPVILDVVEQPAEFPGGKEAMIMFLQKNIKIPAVAEEIGVNGKVYLKFVVSETGNISNVSVKKGVTDCPECDAEAIRVIKKMPDWIPAKNDGRAVNSWFTLPVSFTTK